ncbi:MAG: hypothetical protein F6J93_39275 [Oscillatoria sp. SIO1A7]|nr:hypothetical protein [Oscillatoria sp. SIO1A7]
MLQINVLYWNASPQKLMPPTDRVITKNIPLKDPPPRPHPPYLSFPTPYTPHPTPYTPGSGENYYS